MFGSNEIYAKNVFSLTFAFDCATTNSRKGKNLRSGKRNVKYGLNPKVVYPHSFRHRFAKNFLEKYNDISLLADLMGHESIETTRIYLRKTASEQQEIVDKIVTW